MAKNVVCKKCNNLVNGWCEKVIKYTCGAGTPEEAETNCTHFIRGECTSSFCEYRRKKQTNADRIRSMTDEELVVFLDEFSSQCLDCAENAKNESCPIYKEGRYCRPQDIMGWLQQPVEGE